MVWTKQGLKRSYICNGDLLKHYRERRGWTQDDLATVSGYSDRLLSKAENGLAISTTAIDVLAESLSTPEDPIFPEDLISDPLELAKEFFAAIHIDQKKMVDVTRHFLAEDVVFNIAGDPEVIPFAGKYHGIEGVEKFIEVFFMVLEVPENYDHTLYYQYYVEGNDVFATIESWVHPIGKPLEKPIAGTNHLLFRRGKLILFDDMYDTHAGVQAIQEGNC